MTAPMPDIPAEAVRAAAKASSLHFEFCDEPRWQDCAECVRVVERTERGLKAAAPFMAGVGSPSSCPSAAPESTQSPETTVGAPVYRSGVERPAETLSAPPGEPADLAAARKRIERAHTELGDVCAQGPSRRFKMHIPADPERDTDLIISAALDDAERLAGEVERLRAALFDVARTCGADLDGAKTAEDVSDVAALALDAARDLRADYDETGAAIEKAEAALARAKAEHARDDSNPHGPWCGTCMTFWPCRTWIVLDGAGAVPEHTAPATTEETNPHA